MNLSHTRIAVADLVPMDLSSAKRISFSGDLVSPTLLKEPSQAERNAQIAKQNAEPVQAVFRANGRVVATMSASGSTIFSNADAPASDQALTVESLTAALLKRYGNALQVERFASGTGPAYGAIMAEVYGGKGNLINTNV